MTIDDVLVPSYVLIHYHLACHLIFWLVYQEQMLSFISLVSPQRISHPMRCHS